MFSETTTTEYAAALADDMAAHGVELLQDAELLLADLQTMPLPAALAAEAAQHRAALISAQAFYSAVSGRLEASATI